MQIVTERQSASKSMQSREARNPRVTRSHNAPYRGGEMEDREPPSPTQRYNYHEHYHNFHHSNDYHHNGSDHHRNDYPLRNDSGDTHQRCNCENCRRTNDSRYYDDRGRCTNDYGQGPHHDYEQHERREASSLNDYRSSGNHDRREYASEPAHGNYSHGSRDPMSRRSHEQFRSGYSHDHRRSNYDSDRFDDRHRHDHNTSHERVGQNHHYEREKPPSTMPMSPLSLPTFAYYRSSHNRQVWSPKSDNATLHTETFEVPHYVTSFEKNAQREHHGHYDGGYHERREMNRGNRNGRYSDGSRRDQPQRYDDMDHHYENERIESGDYRYPDDRQSHRHQRDNIPSQVSYPSSLADRRDDYSGSTIPTHSTEHQRRNPSPQEHRHQHVRQDSRPNLRVDIPISPIVSPNNQQSYHGQGYHQQQHHTSRSSGYHCAPSQNNPPITTRSDPIPQPSRASRVAVAERERKKSYARHQILKEIHQATNMRNEALDANDKRFWERQIATLNESFKNL